MNLHDFASRLDEDLKIYLYPQFLPNNEGVNELRHCCYEAFFFWLRRIIHLWVDRHSVQTFILSRIKLTSQAN